MLMDWDHIDKWNDCHFIPLISMFVLLLRIAFIIWTYQVMYSNWLRACLLEQTKTRKINVERR